MKEIENNPDAFRFLSAFFQPLFYSEQLPSTECLSVLRNSALCQFQIYSGFKVVLGINQSYLSLGQSQHVDECPEENIKQWWVCPLNNSLKLRIQEATKKKLCSEIIGFELFQGEKSCSFSLLPSNSEYSLGWLELLFQKVNIFGFDQYYKPKKYLQKTGRVSIIKSEDKKTLDVCAVKGYSKELLAEDGTLAQSLEREIKILRGLDHPGILKLKAVHESLNSLYVVNQILQGGTLKDRLTDTIGSFSKLSYQEKKYLIFDILKTLQYLSLKKISHGKLNPRNIMFHSQKNSRPVLIDFQNANFTNTPHTPKALQQEMSGFLPPQFLYKDENLKVPVTEKCDVFSLGIIWFLLLSGRKPDMDELVEQQLKEESIYWQNCACSLGCKEECKQQRKNGLDLLKKMLQVQPRNRISVNQALEHLYFKNLNETRLKQHEQTMQGYRFDRS